MFQRFISVEEERERDERLRRLRKEKVLTIAERRKKQRKFKALSFEERKEIVLKPLIESIQPSKKKEEFDEAVELATAQRQKKTVTRQIKRAARTIPEVTKSIGKPIKDDKLSAFSIAKSVKDIRSPPPSPLKSPISSQFASPLPSPPLTRQTSEELLFNIGSLLGNITSIHPQTLPQSSTQEFDSLFGDKGKTKLDIIRNSSLEMPALEPGTDEIDIRDFS